MFRSVSRLLSDNPAQANYGISVTDIDGDGEFECFVCGFGCRNQVLKWGGDAFFDVSTNFLADAGSFSLGVAAADIDGDGREEIYVANAAPTGGFEQRGDQLFAWRKGTWVNLWTMSANVSLVDRKATRSVVAIDRYGLGRYGFLVASESGPLRLYELMAEDSLREVGGMAGLARIAAGRSIVAGPIVSEGIDVLAGNEGGPNFLFACRPSGTFLEAALGAGLADAGQHAAALALFDANQDGRFDVICANSRGPHRLFVQGAAGRFIDLASQTFAEASRVQNVVVADFDNDGYEEIFLNNLGQPNRLFAWRNGDWVPADCGEALEVAGNGTGAAVGDFNQDGRLELLIAHGELGLEPLTLYTAHSNGNNWLRILPLTAAGAPARGAFVSLTSRGRKQIRVIDSGSGSLCQMEPVAHFGVGKELQVDCVEVRWPDGALQRTEAPPINQTLTIPYPAKQ